MDGLFKAKCRRRVLYGRILKGRWSLRYIVAVFITYCSIGCRRSFLQGGLTYVRITSCVLFVSGEGGMFYAVFTTPPNAIPGSAVCKFSVKDLTDSFHQGGFKYQVS